jgi:hypothetical protein
MWGAESVPVGLRFPQELHTLVDPEPVAALPLEVHLEADRCRLRWDWQDVYLPAVAELVATSPRKSWRCRIGRLDLVSRSGGLELLILDSRANPDCRLGAATLCSSCLWSPERHGAWLEIWLTDGRGRLQLAARSSYPLPALTTALPRGLALQTSPQPIGGCLHCGFRLFEEAPVTLELADVAGRRLGGHACGTLAAGAHTVLWDLREALGGARSSGIFWLRLQAGEQREHVRLCCLR